MKKKNLELWNVRLLKADLKLIDCLAVVERESPWSVVHRALVAMKTNIDKLNAKERIKK